MLVTSEVATNGAASIELADRAYFAVRLGNANIGTRRHCHRTCDQKMAINQHAQKPENSYARYAYLSSIYFLSVGVLYLWGYWATFDVNILEYAGIADILKTAAYPIASTFIFFAVGAVSGELLVGRAHLPQGGGSASPIGRFLHRVAPIIVPVYFVGTGLLFVLGPVEKWRILPILVVFPVYIVLKRQRIFEDVIPNESTRSIVIFLIVALPLSAYGYGKLKATGVIEGRSYSYLLNQSDGLPTPVVSGPEHRLRFIGQVNDYLFFYNPDNKSTLIVKFEHAKLIELKVYAEKPSTITSVPSGVQRNQPASTQVER
jgi:hypothetical protein